VFQRHECGFPSSGGKAFFHLSDAWKSADPGPERFIAPVLFVDGNSQAFDFSTVIKMDPLHCLEPTKDWTW
jgi:hypothetical protein